MSIEYKILEGPVEFDIIADAEDFARGCLVQSPTMRAMVAQAHELFASAPDLEQAVADVWPDRPPWWMLMTIDLSVTPENHRWWDPHSGATIGSMWSAGKIDIGPPPQTDPPWEELTRYR